MINHPDNSGAQSVDVRLRLEVGGSVVELASIGPDEIVLREPAVLRSQEGVVVLEGAGRTSRWRAHIESQSQPARVYRVVLHPLEGKAAA